MNHSRGAISDYPRYQESEILTLPSKAVTAHFIRRYKTFSNLKKKTVEIFNRVSHCQKLLDFLTFSFFTTIVLKKAVGNIYRSINCFH